MYQACSKESKWALLYSTLTTFFYDILIFCDESIDDSIKIKYISELYCKASGMTINEANVRICNDDLCGILVKYNSKE